MGAAKKEAAKEATPKKDKVKAFPKWRKVVAVLLLVVGAVSFGLGSVAFWINRSLVETEGFVQLTDDLMAQEEIRAALAEGMVDAILEEVPPQVRLARSVLIDVIAAVLEDERVQDLFSTAVETGHRNLMEGELPDFAFGVPTAMKNIKDGVAFFEPKLAEQLPDGSGLADTLEIGSDVVGTIRGWARFIEQMVSILFLTALLGFAGGILLTERKWHGVFLLGWVLAGTIVAMFLLFYFLRIIITSQPADATVRAAVDAGWRVAVRGIRINMLITAILGVVLAFLGKWADGGGVARLWVRIKEQWTIWRSGERPGDLIWKYVPGVSGKAIAIILAIVGVIAIAWPEPSAGFIALLFGLVLLAIAGLAFVSGRGTKTEQGEVVKGSTKDFGKKLSEIAEGTRDKIRGKSTGESTYTDELKALGELRSEGIITDKEFNAKKKKILGL